MGLLSTLAKNIVTKQVSKQVAQKPKIKGVSTQAATTRTPTQSLNYTPVPNYTPSTSTRPKTTNVPTSQPKTQTQQSAQNTGGSVQQDNGTSNYFKDEQGLAQSSYDQENEMSDNEYDSYIQQALQNRSFAEEEYNRSNQNLLSALEGVKGSITGAKTAANETYDADVKTAADTAQSVERRNRNTLRALGILGSSAAGDILSRPWQEFDQQKASMRTGLTSRLQELDNTLTQKTQEHANMVADLNSKYQQLIGQISSDISYTQKERRSAREQANLAYQQRLQEIRASQLNYEMQVEAAKSNLGTYDSGLDTGGINNSAYNAAGTQPKSSSAYMYDEQRKREEQGFVPASGYDQKYANYQPQYSLGGY